MKGQYNKAFSNAWRVGVIQKISTLLNKLPTILGFGKDEKVGSGELINKNLICDGRGLSFPPGPHGSGNLTNILSILYGEGNNLGKVGQGQLVNHQALIYGSGFVQQTGKGKRICLQAYLGSISTIYCVLDSTVSIEGKMDSSTTLQTELNLAEQEYC